MSLDDWPFPIERHLLSSQAIFLHILLNEMERSRALEKSNLLVCLPVDKVWIYEEIMTNDDNLESNLLTSSLLKMCCLIQVELEMFTAW